MTLRHRGRSLAFRVAMSLLAAHLAAPAAPPVRYELGDPIFHTVGDSRSIPEKDVACLTQDAAGFLWIGTRDGVVRYDGYAFRSFRNDSRDPRSLVGNRIRVLRGTQDGRVWIGTDDSGISIFDPKTETFQNLTATKGGLSSDAIRDLAEDAGRVWVASTRGLDLVDGKSLAVTHVDAKPKGAADGNPGLGALLVDRRGDLWIGRADGLAVRRRSGAIEAVAAAPAEGDSLAGKPVYRLFEAPDGAIWIGIFGGGLARLDPASLAVRVLDRENAIRPHAFASPEPGTVWVGTSADGIEVRDAATGALLRSHRHDASVPESIAGNRIASVFVDRSGITWIGTTGSGLSRYNPHDSAFRLLRHSPIRADGLTNGEVECVFESQDGLLWVGTHDNGVDVFDSTRRVTGYRPGDDERSLARSAVTAIAEGPDGAIWIGTSGVLHRLDRKSGRLQRFPFQPFGKTTGRITKLTPSPDGRGFWAGSTAGLAFFDRSTGTSVAAELDGGKPFTGNVTDIAFDRDGVLWVTSLTGVAALPKGKARFRRFTPQENTAGTLPPGSALAVFPDSKARLHFGMSNGLLRLAFFDGTTARFESIAARLGLENRRAQNLLEDGSGRLWIEDGVVFDPATYEKRTFGPDEGAGRNIWRGAAIRTRSGQLVLGGPDGLYFIDPTAVRGWSYAPPVVLTGLLVDGKARPAGGLSRLVVPPGTNAVTFEFAALDFSAPLRNRYSYRLSGFDRSFTDAGAEHRTASYTALPPGDYVFEVRGSNREGAMSPSVLSLPVLVQPTLFQRTPFRIAAGLLLVSLTWPLYRIRIRLLEARQRELERLVANRTLELRASEQQAREASEAKSTFLANMSHELRTPLNAVLGFAQLMRRSRSLGPSDRENLSIIQRSGEHLLSLINQVLSISKIEAGKMTLDVRPFDLRELLQTIGRMFLSRTEEAGLAFHLEIDESIPAAVRGDAGKLRQALINLLGNAVKFTSRGSISLTARWTEGRAWFSVSDTGHGISEEELPALFQPFAQTESGRAAKEGTGLGLAITRRIVELQGGTIQVESRIGAGTTFRFDVALEPCDAVPEERELRRVSRLAPGQRSPRLLVVDDTPENRALSRKLLEAVGLDVREAENGAEALICWRDWRPDLVFMDMRMPVMDGREAIRRIREEEAGGVPRAASVPRTAIVALTASVFEQDRDALLAGGADDVIFKPYREDALFEVIASRLGVRFEYESGGGVTGRLRVPPPAAATARPHRPAIAPAGSKGRLLVTDDDPVNRMLAKELLKSAGYEVVEATDGEDALSRLEGEGPFDAVLLDVEMPRLGGLETVKRIRADGRLRGLPVLAMTAHDDPADLARLVAAGMDDYLVKPFEPEELTGKLAASIERRRSRAAP